jgi:hypothetical protein
MSCGLMGLGAETAVNLHVFRRLLRCCDWRDGILEEKRRFARKNKTAMSNDTMGLWGETGNIVFAFSLLFILSSSQRVEPGRLACGRGLDHLAFCLKNTKGPHEASLFLSI